MIRQLFFLKLLVYLSHSTMAQITYNQHIKPIIDKNCVSCHSIGGIGPFSLENYENIVKRADFIVEVTQSKYMPPFRADVTFQHYANERSLSNTEIEAIQKWVAGGAKEGESLKTKAKNLKLTAQKPKPDLVLKMQSPFKIPDTGEEEFRYFHVPTNLKKDVMVEAIEFVAGNRKVLHHSRVMVDTSGKMKEIEGLRADDVRLETFQKIPMADQFLYGWVPGNDRVEFPVGIAKKLYAGTNLVMNLHYSPSAKIQTDQSAVNLYFTKKPVKRQVQSLLLFEKDITNPPFIIKANSKPTFYISHGPTKEDISAISVLPHMHWLGKTFKSFAITPEGDVVPLIKIDHWDFNWQMTYRFKTLLKIPKGSIIIAEATYDNTTENPLNPNKNPIDVTYGWSSTSEMMDLVIYYVPYKKGDEKIAQ
jgi:Copper type II ascorbate-dependent monooxygenase, C-terminal domain